MNLQKSAWGSGSCYLNLGWDTRVARGSFRPENKCIIRLRAERTEVIPRISVVSPDGRSTIELPGISLLAADTAELMTQCQFVEELSATVVTPVADFMDRTPSIGEMAPFLTAHPMYLSRDALDELRRRGLGEPLAGS